MIFNSTFFKTNRKKLTKLLPADVPVVLASNGLMQRNSDIAFPFRQDSSFWYLTGLNEPDLILLMYRGEEFIIVANRDKKREVFDGSINHDELKKISGVDYVLDESEGWQKLKSSIHNNVATIKVPEPFSINFGIYLNPSRYNVMQKLKTQYNVEIIDISKEITSLRMIKQNPEIDAIKKAISISTEIFQEINKEIGLFTSEAEVNAKINTMFAYRNVVPAYESIVASGSNACTLHYVKNNSLIDSKSLLLIDAGAEYENYASDITRTYSIGEPSKRQKQVHAKVLQVQDYAKSILKPGIKIKDYELLVEDFMGEKLMELDLISKKEKEQIRKYYPHATSHHLGLDTHDVADYESELKENMILTVEPGIYIPEESIGIRVEDDVRLIEGESPEVLSESLYRNL